MNERETYVRATLDDLAVRRRHVTSAIVTLAAFYQLDPAPYLDVPAFATVDLTQPGGAPAPPPQKVPLAQKGTKRAVRPTAAASDHETRILAALKKTGEPIQPKALAELLGLEIGTLRYQLKKLEDRKLVIVSGVTSGRRIALP